MNTLTFSTASQKDIMKRLLFRKLYIFVGVTLLFFLLLLSSLGNTSASDIQQTDLPDQDRDGLSDALENMLGTNNNSKFGDKDMDGLYDFEEYLDYYGSNDTTNQTYAYNNATSVVDGLGDLYHLFGLSSNKTGYLRNRSFNQQNGGFTNYLLWNINFAVFLAGGSFGGNVTYNNNTMTNVNFTGQRTGGSHSGNVTYSNNTMTNVVFGNDGSGGSFSGSVTYSNNTMTNVVFAGNGSGGKHDGNQIAVTYRENTMTNVNFTGIRAGGAFAGLVNYSGNVFTNVSFSGENAGSNHAKIADVDYMNNKIVSDSYDTDGDGLGDAWERIYASVSGVDPLTAADLGSDADGDGLNLTEEIRANTDPGSRDTDSDGLNDKWELTYMAASGVNPIVTATTSELAFDMDKDDLNLTEEEKANTDPRLNDTDNDGLSDSYELEISTNPLLNDTDSDGLSDSYELEISTNPGSRDTDSDGLSDSYELEISTDPRLNDTDSDDLNDSYELEISTNPLLNDTDSDGLNDGYELEISTNPRLNDTDSDGLNDSYELEISTDPLLSDTDGDSLPDGWEVTYIAISGIDPLIVVTESILVSDTDNDGLNIREEGKAGTSPETDDTDEDGLLDGWEVTHSTVPGIDPLVAATDSFLASDADDDGLNITEEFKAKTHPISRDTDGDGLPDGWEVTYSNAAGVNPIVAATATELASDVDNDGLNLLEEAEGNTDPEMADNSASSSTMKTTNTTVSSSETSEESTSVLFIILAIITFIILVVVVCIVIFRKKIIDFLNKTKDKFSERY